MERFLAEPRAEELALVPRLGKRGLRRNQDIIMVKILILNGVPRKNGETASLTKEFVALTRTTKKERMSEVMR